MKKLNPFYLFVFFATVFTACSEDADYVYKAPKDNVYFNFSDQSNNRILYSFADTSLDVVEVTLYLPVSISGNRVSRERKFGISLIDSVTTAQSGLHYAPLDAEYTVPSDSGAFRLPVTLYNKDDALTETTFTLGILLTESTDLGVGFPHLITANIVFSSRLEEPDWWMYWMSELGLYSRTKHFLFLISSGTKALHNPASPDGYMYTPKALYHISEYKSFLSDPFAWTEKNPDYALDQQTDGYYLFYFKATPEKTYPLEWNAPAGKFYFIDEKGEYIL
jgi:hypothetical protein